MEGQVGLSCLEKIRLNIGLMKVVILIIVSL